MAWSSYSTASQDRMQQPISFVTKVQHGLKVQEMRLREILQETDQ